MLEINLSLDYLILDTWFLIVDGLFLIFDTEFLIFDTVFLILEGSWKTALRWLSLGLGGLRWLLRSFWNSVTTWNDEFTTETFISYQKWLKWMRWQRILKETISETISFVMSPDKMDICNMNGMWLLLPKKSYLAPQVYEDCRRWDVYHRC